MSNMHEIAFDKLKGTVQEHMETQTVDEYGQFVPIKTSTGLVYRPKDQYVNKVQYNQLHLVQCEQSVATMISNPFIAKYEIRPEYITGPITDMYIHLVLTMAGAIQLAPIPRIFRAIVLRNAHNEKITEIPPEQILYYDMAMIKDRKRVKRTLELMNTNKYLVNLYNTSLGITSHQFYIPITCFLTNSTVIMPTFKDKIIFELEVESTSNKFLMSGTLSNITVTNCDLYIQTVKLPDGVMRMYKNLMNSNKFTYIQETMIKQTTAPVLTASTSTSIPLTALHGKFSSILVGIRPTITTYYTENYGTLSSDGFINLKTKSGDKIIYNSNMKANVLKDGMGICNYNNMMSKYSNLYYMSFADYPHEQYQGGNHGSIYLTGDEQIELIPGVTSNAETAESVTFVASAQLTAGTYQLSFGNSISGVIAFDATAATINAAIAAMQSVKDMNLAVASTTTLAAAGATLTLSISNLDLVNKLYKLAPSACGLNFAITNNACYSAGPVFATFTYACGTTGIPRAGLYAASASTFTVDIMGIRLDTITIDTDGEIKVYTN